MARFRLDMRRQMASDHHQVEPTEFSPKFAKNLSVSIAMHNSTEQPPKRIG